MSRFLPGILSAPGGLTVTVAAGGNTAGLTVTQNDTTNNPITLALNNSGTGATLTVTPTGNAGTSIVTGGALKLDGTGSTGLGALFYSNQSAPAGRLVVVNAANATFNQSAVRVEHAGTGRGVDVNQSGTGIGLNVAASGGATASQHAAAISLANTGSSTSCALSLSSTNTAHSCLQISSVETGKGAIKIAHTGTGADGNASGVSIDLQGAGTAAQGIFIDSTGGGTTGSLLNLRNNGNVILNLSSPAFTYGVFTLTGRAIASDSFTMKVKAGTPVDGDFAAAPPDGTVVVDTTASKLWARVGGTWKGVAIA